MCSTMSSLVIVSKAKHLGECNRIQHVSNMLVEKLWSIVMVPFSASWRKRQKLQI